MLENTERAIKKGNREKLATQGTQDTGQINVREYRRGNKNEQTRETGNIGYTRDRTNKCWRIPKGNEKNGNPEKLAIQGTQDTGQINLREYRRGNKNEQTRETGSIGYTRDRTNKCQRIPKVE